MDAASSLGYDGLSVGGQVKYDVTGQHHTGGDPAPSADDIAFTREAIEEAFHHPRSIDMQLVDAQQARRILDRLVGYKLSPLLWKKVRGRLSAGRVQSVALRLVVDREIEIEQFKTQEYWTVEADVSANSDPFLARLKDGAALHAAALIGSR